MRTELGPKEAGRIAAYLFIASGVLSALALPLPQLPGINPRAVLALSGLAVVAGGIAHVLPWSKWGKRWTLVLLPVAFVIIGLGNYYGSARSYSYSLFFIVAFVWLGICQPRRMSFFFAPLAAIAYVAPILIRSGENAAADAAAGALTIPVCVIVAEILSWIVERELRSRLVAQALLRVGSRLGQHLTEAELCQSLVEESRQSLAAEHAILFRIDPDERQVTGMYSAGIDEELAHRLQRMVGQPTPDTPEKLLNGEPIVVEHAGKSPRQDDLDMFRRFGVKSYVAFPVMSRHELIGVLSCWETSRFRRYSFDDLALAAGLAGQASAAFQNARLYEQTLAASRADSLTGLGNRRAFHERLESEVERARRYGRTLSLIVLDTDNFKQINDTFGHQGGDRVLVLLGELLKRNRRMEDGTFRIGGDEYALILPETGQEGATTLAERLRRRIEHAALGSERDVPLTASIGVASFGEDGINVDELFERADSALYDVKAAGGNAIALPAKTEGTHIRLGVDISAIIDGECLRPAYQPIFDLLSGAVAGFETFCRLDADLGFTPTPTLFRAAAAAGRLRELDRACRKIALRGIGEAELLAGELIFLNVAPGTVQADDFDPQELIDEIKGAGLSVDRTVIEITEHERIPSSKQLANNLRACRNAGLMVALDDFGAGSADLDLLANTRFDYVKVDMSFVTKANGIDTRRRVLRGLAVIAAESGAQTIAEGIESADDLSLVRELGFSAAQGFLLREPSGSLDHSPRPLRQMSHHEPVSAL